MIDMVACFFFYDTFEAEMTDKINVKATFAKENKLTSILQPLILFPWVKEEVDALDDGQNPWILGPLAAKRGHQKN